MRATTSLRRRSMLAATLIALQACAAAPGLRIGQMPRPPALVGEWVDVRHTIAGDTALWVLRADGYDGSARIVRDSVENHGALARSEHRYGSWYLHGNIDDEANRALCFSRRIGRDGATCLRFALDTIRVDGSERRRLTIRNYQGQHTTADRQLIERVGSTR